MAVTENSAQHVIAIAQHTRDSSGADIAIIVS